MNIDVIILSLTADEQIYNMTKNALNSLHCSESNYVFDTVLVETDNRVGKEYDYCRVIEPKESFNFNRFLNIGLNNSRGAEYVVLSNNDVFFTENWFTEIHKAMVENKLDSASPRDVNWQFHTGFDAGIHHGWGIGWQFCGWLLVFRRESLEKLLPFDEDFEFWCGDNFLTHQMQQLGMKHALVGSAQVTHLANQSHRLVEPDLFVRYTHGAIPILERKLNQN